jgi:hypothetical protein
MDKWFFYFSILFWEFGRFAVVAGECGEAALPCNHGKPHSSKNKDVIYFL